MPLVTVLELAADPAAWRRLGFSVDVSSSRLGRIEPRYTRGAGEGIVGWSLDGRVPA